MQYLADNFRGTFSWKKYIAQGFHDHKFGPNKLDFICQLPAIGLVTQAVLYILLFLLIALIRPIQYYQKFKESRHEKQTKSCS